MIKELILYLHEPILIRVGEKPISKYNADHNIHSYFIDKVVTEIDHYRALFQIRLWFEEELGDNLVEPISSITFFNPTYSIEND